MIRKQSLLGMILLSCLCLICANSALGYASQADQAQPAKTAAQEPASRMEELVIKTYALKHIKPEELLKATRIFIEDASFSDSMVTIKIWSSRIPKFEEMLNKLDVERKPIQFQVFAIVATREAEGDRKAGMGEEQTSSGQAQKTRPSAITSVTGENKELRRVLDELKALWNFKTYDVDGPSFVTVREDTGPNNFKLVTNRELNLVVSNVKVMGDEPGKRIVSIEQLKLTGRRNFVDYVFVDTHDVTLKEKGYLVAGVSGYGSATNALILVISAEIK